VGYQVKLVNDPYSYAPENDKASIPKGYREKLTVDLPRARTLVGSGTPSSADQFINRLGVRGDSSFEKNKGAQARYLVES